MICVNTRVNYGNHRHAGNIGRIFVNFEGVDIGIDSAIFNYQLVIFVTFIPENMVVTLSLVIQAPLVAVKGVVRRLI